jgi:hypothetical protein
LRLRLILLSRWTVLLWCRAILLCGLRGTIRLCLRPVLFRRRTVLRSGRRSILFGWWCRTIRLRLRPILLCGLGRTVLLRRSRLLSRRPVCRGLVRCGLTWAISTTCRCSLLNRMGLRSRQRMAGRRRSWPSRRSLPYYRMGRCWRSHFLQLRARDWLSRICSQRLLLFRKRRWRRRRRFLGNHLALSNGRWRCGNMSGGRSAATINCLARRNNSDMRGNRRTG